MLNYELENADREGVEDVLQQFEVSFNIKFAANEFVGISTFGELCDHITNKMGDNNSADCTSQQAFYKLRNAFHSALNTDNIKPDTLLADILPTQNRISSVRQLEQHLGFKLSV